MPHGDYPIQHYTRNRLTGLYAIAPSVMAEQRPSPLTQLLDYAVFLVGNAACDALDAWRKANAVLVAFRDSDAARWIIFATAFCLYVAIGAGWGMPH